MDDLKMDELNGVQAISAEEQRLQDLKKKLRWFTAIIIVLSIAIAGMLTVNFYPELLRRILGDQERGEIANASVTYTNTNVASTRNLRSISGTTSQAYLGVEIQNLSETMTSALNLKSTNGVVITRVTPSSPADVSGLEAGDIIIRFDRARIKSTSDIQEVLKDEDPGDVIKVVVDRDGMTRTFYVELGSLSSTYARQTALTAAATTTQQTSEWGCTLSSLTPDLVARLSLPNSIEGVVVVAVSATGLAKSAGILVGDVIMKVNRHVTANLQDFYLSIENQTLVVLEIFRSGRLTYIQIQSANAIPPVATIAGTVEETPPALQNRVAIAANGNNLNAQLAPYFGSAPFFIIVDLNTKQYSVIPNNSATGTVPYGIAAVQLVTASGATAVIAQNYGPVIYQALMAAQLKLYRADDGKVSDALAQYENYLLTQVENPTVQGMTRNMVPTGGSPFTSDEDDDEEEQSGYKGMPYSIPPQGKYDPDLDPANAAQTTAGSTQNRVAIASMGTGISSAVAPLFGTAPYFIIYDSSTNQYQYMKNPALGETRSYGAIATQAIIAQNIDAVIAGNFGSRAYTALMALTINPYVFQGSVANAINAYRSGKLTPAVSMSLPGFSYTQNIVPTGGSPFSTEDEDDEEEEQSGYKGMPYSIPPQGKYDPELDPNNAPETNQTTAAQPTNPALPQRVAIAAIGNNLNASMASVFRTAPFFIIFDIQTNNYFSIQNLYTTNMVGTSTVQPSQLVASSGAGAAIAGMYGSVCYSLLTSYNIVPYSSNPGTVSEVLQLYKSGALKVVSQAGSLPLQTQTQSQLLQTTAGSTQRTDYCYCPYCQITVPHPSSVPCSALECPQCGNRLMNFDASGTLQTAVTPQLPLYSSVVAGVLSAGTTQYVQVPLTSQQLPTTYVLPQSQYYQDLIQNQLRTGSTYNATDPANTLNLNQQTQYCYCPHCNVVYEHPRGVPCSSLTCSACGNRLISLNSGIINQLTEYGTTVSGQPATIPPMGQTTAGVAVSGQPATIPPMGQTSAGVAVSGQPATIPPMGQTTAGVAVSGQPATIPPMGQTTAGMPVAGQPTTIPMGQTTAGMPTAGQTVAGMPVAGMPVAGQPTTIPMGQTTAGMPTAGQTVAGMPVAGQPTTIPMGQTTAGMPTAGQTVAGMPTAGQTVAGMPVAGMPVAGMPVAGMPVAGQPTTIPMGQTTAGMPVAGQPTTIPMGQTTAGMPVAGQPTTIPMGQTSAGTTVAYQSVAGMPVAGQPTTIPMGQTTAGMPVAGMPVAGMPVAGMPVAGMPVAGMPVAGQPETIPPMGQTVAGTVNQTSTGALQGTVDGNCVCPVCGTTVPHERGTACYTIPCPKCKTLMVNEGAIINRTALTTALNTNIGQLTTALTIAGPPASIPLETNTTIPGQINTTNTTDTFTATPVAGIIDLPAMTIAGTGSGSVCIAATGSTLDSQVADIFDKAPYFLIVGLGKIKAIPNPNVTDLIGSGVQSAQLIVSEGAKVVITNDIGIRAFKELNSLNVKVYTGIKGSAEQALSWFQDNRLSPTVLGSNNSTTEEEHGPPTSSKSKSKGETSL